MLFIHRHQQELRREQNVPTEPVGPTAATATSEAVREMTPGPRQVEVTPSWTLHGHQQQSSRTHQTRTEASGSTAAQTTIEAVVEMMPPLRPQTDATPAICIGVTLVTVYQMYEGSLC